MSASTNSTSLSTTSLQELPDSALAFEGARNGALSLVDLINATQDLLGANQPVQAVALYRMWLQNMRSPLAYIVHFNLGVTLSTMRDEVAAEQAYRSALSLKPDFIEAHLNLGTLQERQGAPEQALQTWREALKIISSQVTADQALHTQTLNNLGRLLEIRKCYPEAGDMLRRSLEIDPSQPNAITHWVHLRQKQCKWPVYSPIEGLPMAEMVHATSALATLSASGDPAVQLAAARRYVAEKVLPEQAVPLAAMSGYGHQRLRIGYLSSDFCSHAVLLLTAELFELHDRAKVEVYAFCWSREDGSPLRARVIKAMDHHIRIGAMSDEEAAHCIRSHEIDILIDLHGLTLGARQDILSYRPAPVQMTYLGFPGSTALPCIDYVLADKFVLPPELAPFFTEKPLYLPNTFQVNDRQRAIGLRPSKTSCGLPEDTFIFCSFNNNYKFTPEVFACWMRILKRSPSSVLWLIADSDDIRETLWLQAEQHGVPRARLFFAGRVLPADYLARYQVADLFLDTLPFNAGTTASDALWAGLPLLTCAGATFASRMAGSLLLAVDLPQLITYNLQDYEDKAVELAKQPERIAAMKQQLADNRLSCALFDTPRFVQDLEAEYQRLIGELSKNVNDCVQSKWQSNTFQNDMNQIQLKQANPLKKLVVEGWKEINHSFALVNQFQLLEMAQRPDLALQHTDVPFHFNHWNRAANGAGFHTMDEATLAGIAKAETKSSRDWTYRIFSPIDLRCSPAGGKLAVYLVTELGLNEQSFVAGSDIKQFESNSNLIITPSRWSRDRIIDWGFQPHTVHVVPHAASPDYFYPLPPEVIKNQRVALGFHEDEILFLNIGAAIWNKGMDVLIKGFALARQKRKDLRLVFKDQRNIYGINGDNYVRSTLAAAGLLTDDVISAITLIPFNLTMDQMNSMYGIADCYVSPYRAEGFNLPVCEAMACGTPVLVTAGGATDDFVQGDVHRKISAVIHKNLLVQEQIISAYCEPDLNELVELLVVTQPKTKMLSQSTLPALSWNSPTQLLLNLMQ